MMKALTISAASFSCHEFTEGLVFEDDNLKVHALRVEHPPVTDCFALKFETETAKIVFGATEPTSRPWQNLPKMPIFWCMKRCT